MKSICRAFLLIFAATWLLSGVHAWAQSPADTLAREPAQAYMALVRGDQARESGDWEAALAAYKEARERYQRISQFRPDWETDIVQYRLIYCENQMKTARKKLGPGYEEPEPVVELDAVTAEAGDEEGEAEPAGEDEPYEEVAVGEDEDGAMAMQEESEGVTYRDRYLSVMHENEYLRQRIDELIEEEEEEDPGALGEMSEVNRELRTELEAQLESVKNLQRRIAELETENYEIAMALADTPDQVPVPEPSAEASSLAVRYREALESEKAGDYAAALDVYESIRDENADAVDASKGMSRCLIALGRGPDAVIVLRQAVAAAPEDVQLKTLLGLACGAAGKYRQAVDILQPITETDSWNAAAAGGLGAAYLGMGELDAARRELEKAVEADPRSADAFYNLALVLVQGDDGEKDQAADSYKRALELGAARDTQLEEILQGPPGGR